MTLMVSNWGKYHQLKLFESELTSRGFVILPSLSAELSLNQDKTHAEAREEQLAASTEASVNLLLVPTAAAAAAVTLSPAPHSSHSQNTHKKL